MQSNARMETKRDTWLVLDVSCLAWRSFYSIGNLSYEGISTGVVFSILKDIIDLQGRFGTKRIAFCFDRGRPRRCLIYPQYKQARRQKAAADPELSKAKKNVRKQLIALHDDYLPSIGYRNIFSQVGFEADDMIAAVVDHVVDNGDRAIVVGSDNDLLQLLEYRTRVWNPVKSMLVTKKSFTKKYGIGPGSWALVKAIAGCSSDGVAGITGIGEKTAIKYVSGRLDGSSKAFEKIVKGNSIIDRNVKLVTLPFKGVRKIELKDDEVTRVKFKDVAKRLGINSKRLLMGY